MFAYSPPADVVRIPTADGAQIAVKRKPSAGGPPVIFIHGIAVNADLWDLPEVRGRDFHFRSLASVLHAAGYDVWLMNLRGHGAPFMYSPPAPDQVDWCVDHFILYDLPAVVAHVAAATGQRPFVIGASLGAMTLGGYVQGAVLGGGAGPAARITADPQIAAQRQAQLSGCVFVEFPAALRWPRSVYPGGRLSWRQLFRDFFRKDGDVNYTFEIVARWGWLHALLAAWGQVPLSWLRADPHRGPWYRRLPGRLAGGLERCEHFLVQRLLHVAGTFTGATHHRAEVMLGGHRYILDHMKAGVLRQLAHCVRRGAFVSALGAAEHVYSDHYDLVTTPTLVLQGGRDRIACASVTRAVFFDQIRASDKQFLLFEEIAHGELEAAPVASARVYPLVRAWLDARTPRT